MFLGLVSSRMLTAQMTRMMMTEATLDNLELK